MAELSPDIVPKVVESCKAGAEEAALALERGLDTKAELSVGEPGSVDLRALPEGFDGAGLAVVLMVGSTGALFLVPDSCGFLPDWYGDPDPTGQSKLATLAQELGVLLLPEEYMPTDFKAARVESLSEALARGSVSDGAGILPLEIQGAEGTRATAHLIWPAVSPAATISDQASSASGEEAGSVPPHEAASEDAGPQEAPREVVPPQEPGPTTPQEPKSQGGPQAQSSSESQSAGPQRPPQRPAAGLADLPSYTRSLLRIKLPVVVTLARQRQPMGQILKLGPGSILQFDKSCEETLEMEAGGRLIATGEAVKVGDKFGLRISSMVLPDERFTPVRKA
jgi:flagellar motor switch/type III secretory pathway protein FliN